MNSKFPNVREVCVGRPGCGCGCRGNYTTHASTITRVVNRLLDNASQVKVSTDFDGSLIFALETDERYYWVYTSSKNAMPSVAKVECSDCGDVRGDGHENCPVWDDGAGAVYGAYAL